MSQHVFVNPKLSIIALSLLTACGGGSSGGGSTSLDSNGSSDSMPKDASKVFVQQISPATIVSHSVNFNMVSTLGAAADNSAASSTNYRMQGGLTGANIASR